MPRRLHGRDVVGEIGAVLDEPVQTPVEPAQTLKNLRFERLDRKKRDQPDHRPHLERKSCAVRQVQRIVEESILFIPEIQILTRALLADRMTDIQEVLPEFAGDVFVRGVLVCELYRDRQQVQRVHRHPARAIRLLDMASSGQRRRSVEDADVVEAKEAALEDVTTVSVLAVHPPREVEEKFLEDAFQERPVAAASPPLLNL